MSTETPRSNPCSCWSCGEANKPEAAFCRKCGASLASRGTSDPGEDSIPAPAGSASSFRHEDVAPSFVARAWKPVLVVVTMALAGLLLWPMKMRAPSPAQRASEQHGNVTSASSTSVAVSTAPPRSPEPGRVPDASGGAPTRPVATASSRLNPQSGNVYDPENILDGRLDTAWVAGPPGTGEWVQIEFPIPTLVSEIEIFAGYGKNQLIFEKNNRVKSIQLQFMDEQGQFNVEHSQSISLEDMRRWQSFHLAPPVRTLAVRLLIVAVYRGTAYNDTAISEVRFH